MTHGISRAGISSALFIVSSAIAFATPPTKAAEAQQLVAHFATLTEADKNRLCSLGDDAFPTLLKAYVKTCNAYDASQRGYPNVLYDQFLGIGNCLDKVTSAKRVTDLIHTLDQVPQESSARPLLLNLLGEYGSPKVVTPYFIREIKGVTLPMFQTYDSSTEVARDYLIHSTDPRAIHLLISWMKSPNADPDLRFDAYVHLAGRGGPEGLRAVLAERHHRTLLRPIAVRFQDGYLSAGEFNSVTKPLAQASDSKGRTFGLLKCGLLGNQNDLWIVEKAHGKWINPLFTGVWDQQSDLTPSRNPPTFKGLSAKQLMAGAWFGIVHDPDLSRDSTQCGLTDLEKQRLCLDLGKRDTDDDGDPDGVDPAPNAAPRPLSDAEQVLAAVFEARYHFESGEGPALFEPEDDMRPFELLGRRGPTIWGPDSEHVVHFGPLVESWEQGVAFIGFTAPKLDILRPELYKRGLGQDTVVPNPKAKRWEDRIIAWNPDHTKASLFITTYFGGLDGTGYYAVVQKFGATWVVINMEMAYIS